MNEEIWKELDINKSYLISNFGNLISLKNNKKRVIKGWIQNTGYVTVNVNNKKYSLHRLIAINFIKKTVGKEFVNHIDGNKLNNRTDNLEWCTQKENIQHAFNTGLMDNAKKIIPLMKVRAKNIDQYDLNNNYIKTFIGSIEAEKELKNNDKKVNSRNIRSVCNGERKTAGGYIWKWSKNKRLWKNDRN